MAVYIPQFAYLDEDTYRAAFVFDMAIDPNPIIEYARMLNIGNSLVRVKKLRTLTGPSVNLFMGRPITLYATQDTVYDVPENLTRISYSVIGAPGIITAELYTESLRNSLQGNSYKPR